MEHFILECRLDEPFSKENEKTSSREIDAFLESNGGHWIRSYYNKERTRLICEFSAPDEDVVRKAWEYAKCPIESLWPAVVFQREVFLQTQDQD